MVRKKLLRPDEKDWVQDALEEAGPGAGVSGPLPEYYDALQNGSVWILRCKKCGKGYRLPDGSSHPGNRIALMNHVRTHSELEEL